MFLERDSLQKPLSGDELLYFFSDYHVRDLIEKFTKALINYNDGCFLVGGLRGAGKTSFVELCCNLATKKRYDKMIFIKINMGNKDIKFLNNLVYSLYHTEWPSNLDSFKNDLEKLYKKIFYRFNDSRTINKKEVHSSDKTATKKFDLLIKFFELFALKSGPNFLMEKQNKLTETLSDEKKEELTISELYNDEIQLFSSN